ncbi:uncharacterized protein SPPG_03856 [Spizellomyces punctatus DAOM BR117]|uniref:F-box domain-containing protein n=1 Tax=Spizellomyces punctatus (strain DAOM BR117) TaxID=645134 RepID=A0A0L0HIN0_SPIPD|nr:uncharacterized protein SPPG_03856 [Spizellomyces punctatus DAOM BR117]KND00740.1 hypothetical protein SPPG_03856 [Spizellomyces punctatus DAOM BR117]|eukprot:XP_016608779.1 hypothetical protein SPPG_03856 [Spizellomyces punctatus DAOM BR117]
MSSGTANLVPAEHGTPLSCLPREIFLLILDHTSVHDLLHIRAVCRSWWTDALHTAAIKMNAAKADAATISDRISALVSTDGEWYDEPLKRASLVCSGVRMVGDEEEVQVDYDNADGDPKIRAPQISNVRFVFGPKKGHWPVLGYFVNSEGRIEISINGKLTITFENSSFLSDSVVQRGDGWCIACTLRDRPDIEPGTEKAVGLPSWWTGRRFWGLPSEVYYCDMQVDELEVSLGWMLRLTKPRDGKRSIE